MDTQLSNMLATLFPTYYGTAPTVTPPGTAGSPHVGQGVYGLVPGATAMPSPAADLGAQYPNLTGTNAALSSGILSKIRGEIPLDVQQKIQDAGARFGVTSGMPGSGLARNRTARDLGLTSLDLQNQGIAQYNQTIPTISRTQTVAPETQIALSQANANLAAAPDPALQGIASLDIFNRYMGNMANRGRTSMPSFSPAGGTGTYSTPSYVPKMAPLEPSPMDNMQKLDQNAAAEDYTDWLWNEGGWGLPESPAASTSYEGPLWNGAWAPNENRSEQGMYTGWMDDFGVPVDNLVGQF